MNVASLIGFLMLCFGQESFIHHDFHQKAGSFSEISQQGDTTVLFEDSILKTGVVTQTDAAYLVFQVKESGLSSSCVFQSSGVSDSLLIVYSKDLCVAKSCYKNGDVYLFPYQSFDRNYLYAFNIRSGKIEILSYKCSVATNSSISTLVLVNNQTRNHPKSISIYSVGTGFQFNKMDEFNMSSSVALKYRLFRKDVYNLLNCVTQNLKVVECD